MKRILALLLVLTLSLGILAGCSKDTSGTGDDTGSASKDTVSKRDGFIPCSRKNSGSEVYTIRRQVVFFLRSTGESSNDQ